MTFKETILPDAQNSSSKTKLSDTAQQQQEQEQEQQPSPSSNKTPNFKVEDRSIIQNSSIPSVDPDNIVSSAKPVIASKLARAPSKRRLREEEALLIDSLKLTRGKLRASKKKTSDETLADSYEDDDASSSEVDERALNIRPNIKHVVYCNFKFDAWYRSPRYFDESAPSGVPHCSTSMHLSKQIVKARYNKAIQLLRKRTTDQKAKEFNRKSAEPNQKNSAEHEEESSSDSEDERLEEEIDQNTTLVDTLYICDTCFKYTTDPKEMAIHMPKCRYRDQLPGRVVYDSPYYQIRKIDGARHLLYVQCLSLFAKLFLDHKSICYALESFDFYVLTTSVANIQGINEFATNSDEYFSASIHDLKASHKKPTKSSQPSTETLSPADTTTSHGKKKAVKKSISSKIIEHSTPGDSSSPLSAQRVVGFFSKEKISWDNYNLACIAIFPPFQKRGLGKLLIEYSYYLSRISNSIGTPERPLSTEGLLTYLKYWSNTISFFISTKYHKYHNISIPTSKQKKSKSEDEPQNNQESSISEAPSNESSSASEEKKPELTLSIDEISKETFISPPDVIKALEYMGAIHYKYVDDTADKSREGTVIDVDKVLEWVETFKTKPSLVPLYPEYCIIRRRKLNPNYKEPAVDSPQDSIKEEESDEESEESSDYRRASKRNKKPKTKRKVKRSRTPAKLKTPAPAKSASPVPKQPEIKPENEISLPVNPTSNFLFDDSDVELSSLGDESFDSQG